MDFHIGYFKRYVKVWINNNQDMKEACETLRKVSKLTLWCTGIENGVQKGDEVVQKPDQMMRVSAVQEHSNVITLKNKVHPSKN